MSESCRILAVDDEAACLDAIQAMLADVHTVRVARSGEEALTVADAYLPNVVLLDVTMPGMDGYEACQRLPIRPQLAHTKIIMLSGVEEAQARVAAYQAGADDYLIKPAHRAEILAKVNIWMNTLNRFQSNRLVEETESLRDGMTEALTSVIGFKDVEPREHLFRMRWYSLRLAEQLKISSPYADQIEEGFIRNIYRASPLHDIGMVVVPEEVLRRPASITANERAQIALHTEAGAELLARALRKAGDDSLFAQVAINIARYHHERFDGRGYPTGLTGENIPLEARIVAAADTFDALTSPRVYRQPVSSDEALRIMAEEAGKQLDPVIVEALLESAEEFAGAVQYFRGTTLKSLLSSN